MTLVTKSRVTAIHKYAGKSWRTFGTDTVSSATGTREIWCRQVTKSEGHPWPKGRGQRDVGGEFDTINLTHECSEDGSNTYRVDESPPSAGFVRHYEGSASPQRAGVPTQFSSTATVDGVWTYCPRTSDGGLDAVGSVLIADSLPTNPILSSSVALAELYREGLPSMIGSAFFKQRSDFFRSLGSEYLNYQFGWKPFVADIKAAAKAVMDQELILQQLIRDSGKNVRRKRYLPPVKDTTVATEKVEWPFLVSGAEFTGSPRLRRTETFWTQNYFSGCFTFHFDPMEMSRVQRIAAEARLLWGLELTPEVVWNLAPWSWLIDWISSVGPVLHNVSAFQQDGLVMRYGYVMEENRHAISFTSQGYKPKYGYYPPHSWETFSGIRKTRRKATPFGFGLLTDGFTARQWAILGALGITRTPRSL